MLEESKMLNAAVSRFYKLFNNTFIKCAALSKLCSTKTDFAVGDTAELTKSFTAEDVKTFAALSLDDNPLHVDPAFASTTRFRKCIVHGVLING